MEDQILEVTFYLMAIVGLIVGCGFLLKKVNKSGFQVSGPIKVVASLALGIKEKVVLVQVGEHQQVLLGVSPGRITRLEVFNEPVVALEPEGLDGFKEKLQEIMKNNPE